MRDQDIVKVMKYVKENKAEIEKILAFLNEQETKAETDKQSDPDDKFSDEDTTDVMDKSDCGADEDCDDVMSESEGTEETSDGVTYPDVGDGTGVEGETLKEDDDDLGGDSEEQCDSDDDALAAAGIEETCAGGAGTASVGAATGPAIGVQGTEGSANDGIARFKGRLGGKPEKRYTEGAEINGGAAEVQAMIESWSKVPTYRSMGGF